MVRFDESSTTVTGHAAPTRSLTMLRSTAVSPGCTSLACLAMRRYGMTVPFGAQLANHKELYEELVDLGYTDAWSSEADGTDAFTPLAIHTAWAPTLRLGRPTAPACTRGPA